MHARTYTQIKKSGSVDLHLTENNFKYGILKRCTTLKLLFTSINIHLDNLRILYSVLSTFSTE